MNARHWIALALALAFIGVHVLLLGGQGWRVALVGAGLATSASLLILALLRTVDSIGPEVARITSRGRR